MMNFAPMLFQGTGSQYLNNYLFTTLGFYTGTSSDYMLNLAYVMAERETARQVGTYWLPTTVTGSFAGFNVGDPIYAQAGMIRSIDDVRFFERSAYGEERQISGSGYILDPFNGIFSVQISPYDVSSFSGSYTAIAGQCNGCPVISDAIGLYKVEVAYTAGYESGTWADPTITTAIAMAADQTLKLLRDEGELADEDLQFIKQYSVGRYAQSVEGKWAIQTRFGVSGRSQLIARMLDHWKIKRALNFRR